MRTIKIMAVTATLLVATAGFALACDGNKTSSAKAETASTVKAETASTSGCASSAKAETASATKTAGAGCSSSASAVKTAGAGCSTGATAIKTAGAGCSSSATATAHAMKLETVRMPSGTLAVFYHGTNAETVAMLQGSVEGGVEAFGCSLAKGAAENCNTEMAKTETGMMILVSAEKAEAIDAVEETYAVAVASMNAPSDSDSE